MQADVAIIGGGPGGSSCGAYLKRYKPSCKVHIFERELFPRDHVGESQLPVIGAILDEIGVWDKVEAADFPIKVGGTYRWGNSDDLWDFDFLPQGELKEEPRPARFRGQRTETAFQVDRSVYDKILLDHARSLGCEVHERTKVQSVQVDGGKVLGLTLEDGTSVTARHFIDASGHSGILRRAVGVPVEEPSPLRNVAFWDYWQNAEWAVSLGIGGTRIQIMSVGYGWLWFIPISPSRSSVGFVCPADYYRRSGMKPEDLYARALSDEPRISGLLTKAQCEHLFAATKDWSFLAETMAEENWMLVGESAGFADPILSAGLSLTHASAREAAFTILELERGGDRRWLHEQYTGRNRRRILQHIRFADYWYSANSHFSDLKEYTRQIASEAGLELSAESAFQWLGTGGFIEEDLSVGGFGTVSFNALHQIARRLSSQGAKSAFEGYNGFVLNFEGAKKTTMPHYEDGRVLTIRAFERDGRVLPLSGMVGWMVKGLEHSPRIAEALAAISREMRSVGIEYTRVVHEGALQSLEALVRDGWVDCRRYKAGEALPDMVPPESSYIHENRDRELPHARRPAPR